MILMEAQINYLITVCMSFSHHKIGVVAEYYKSGTSFSA